MATGTVFDLLEDVRKRPSMFFRYDDSQRRLQLLSLEDMLFGYQRALHAHGIREPLARFNLEFALYLSRTREWPGELGPVAAILSETQSEQEAWDVYWKLVDEFRESLASDAK